MNEKPDAEPFKKTKPTPRQEPIEGVDLDSLPRTTLAKNMRNIEDIMAEYIAIGPSELTENEYRLLDLVVKEKTGKHLDKFKDKPPKPTDLTPVVGKGNNPDRANKKILKAPLTMTFHPETVS